MEKSIKVFINELKLHIFCGTSENERDMGVDAKLYIEVESKEFVDYQELYKIATSTAGKKFTYIEELAEQIGSRIMDRWNVTFVRIKIHKLSLPFQNSIGSAGVEITMKK